MNLHNQAKLISKLLHDLIAPASSLLNGVELLDETRIDPEIYSFMKEGATALNEKLKMFRLIYGASGDPSLKQLKDFCTRVDSFLKIYQGHVSFGGDDIEITPMDVKILGGLLVTISHIATLPFEVKIRGDFAAVEILILGLKLILKEESLKALQGKISESSEELTVHVIQPWLISQLAIAERRKIECIHNKPGEIGFLYTKIA